MASPEKLLPPIVKVAPGLKEGEAFEPCGAGVKMLVNVEPTRPGFKTVGALVPPRTPTDMPACPMKDERPFWVPQ